MKQYLSLRLGSWFVVCALFAATANSAPVYRFTDLGTLGEPNSEATAINNAGQVAGFSYTTLGNARATIWDRGILTELRSSNGGPSQAYAINNAGQIAGAVNVASLSVIT